jgi:hypothetical protein
MHVTNNYPANKSFFMAIFGLGIVLRLGLFHFIQRITRTLRKEHINFGLAVALLSKCLYHEDCDDVQDVEFYLKQKDEEEMLMIMTYKKKIVISKQ